MLYIQQVKGFVLQQCRNSIFFSACSFVLHCLIFSPAQAQLAVYLSSKDSLVKTVIEAKTTDSAFKEVSTDYTHIWINRINYKNEGNKDIILLLSKWQILEHRESAIWEGGVKASYNCLFFYNSKYLLSKPIVKINKKRFSHEYIRQFKILKPKESFELIVLIKKESKSLSELCNDKAQFYDKALFTTTYFKPNNSNRFLKRLTNYDLVNESMMYLPTYYKYILKMSSITMFDMSSSYHPYDFTFADKNCRRISSYKENFKAKQFKHESARLKRRLKMQIHEFAISSQAIGR